LCPVNCGRSVIYKFPGGALKFLCTRYFPQCFRRRCPLYFAKKRVQYASG
jgi:hypothetical protein